jgi:hypothetical protein
MTTQYQYVKSGKYYDEIDDIETQLPIKIIGTMKFIRNGFC